MPTIKNTNNNITINTSSVESSNVSSSLNGNMNLIKSQIAKISNDYINIKNATKILDNYSNWNGYIKLYTEIQSNFVVDDIVYITYTSDITGSTIFNIENPSIPDEAANRFYLGYKVLYVNQYKNEIVINRHYNDIPPGKLLQNQYISKISCRGGYLYQDVSDGVVFNNCSIINTGFATIEGIVTYNNHKIEGALVTIAGSNLKTTTDSNGHYILNAAKGDNYIKISSEYYVTTGVTVNINTQLKVIQDISMTTGNNDIQITSNPSNPYDILLNNNVIIFTSTNSGYSQNVKYQWYVRRNYVDSIIGSNSKFFQSNFLLNNDEIFCVVTDNDFSNQTSISNMIKVILYLNLSYGISYVYPCNNYSPSAYYSNTNLLSTSTNIYNSDRTNAINGYYGDGLYYRELSDGVLGPTIYCT